MINSDSAITGIPKQDVVEAGGKRNYNILFLSAYDSTNYVFVNLIKELIIRGHSCTVVVKDKEDAINNKMYRQGNIPVVEVGEFDRKLVVTFDFVFSAPLKYECYKALYKKLNAAGSFIITFANLFSSVAMNIYPDLVLSIGKSKFAEFEENGLRYNQIAIGNPQYDPLVRLRREAGEHSPEGGNQKEDVQKGNIRDESTQKKAIQEEIVLKEGARKKDIRKVIIIEQGAYPYGREGKAQLAGVLCRMARNNPELTFTVKPRYLPSEKGRQLHVLSEHLYDFIEEKPDNLTLLTEPAALEDIVRDFDAAVTTWSTAYLDAALLGLPVIFIEGIPSVDVFNVRRQRIEAAYNRLRHSGCVVHYNVLDQNPLPFSQIEEDFLKEEVYDPYNPCVPRVLELLDLLYGGLIITKKRWKGIHQFEFAEFISHSEEIPLIDVSSNEYKCKKRLFRKANKILQRFIFENRCMGQVMDSNPMKWIWDYPVDGHTGTEELAAAIKRLKQDTEAIKTEFFTSHFDLVCRDRILQDYYFQWLYRRHQYRRLLHYDDTLVCPESLYYYQAIIFYKKHRYKRGTKCMSRFFRLSGSKECKDLRKDRTISPYLWKGRLGKYLILHYLDRYQAYEAIEEIVAGNPVYQVDIALYYRIKSYVRRAMPTQAVTLWEQSARTMPSRMRGKGIRQMAKYYVGQFFREKAQGIINTAVKHGAEEFISSGKSLQ